MSDETQTAEDKELEQMEQQLMEAEANGQKAVVNVDETKTPSPEPVETSPAPEPATTEPMTDVPVAPTPPAPQPAAAGNPADPMAWAKKKGLNTPEDMARALQQKEQEFHRRNQAGHPGYQDLGNPAPVPQVPPQWTPRPDMGAFPPNPGYGYPPPRSRDDIAAELGRRHGVDPEDVRRLLPLIAEVGDVIATGRTQNLEQRVLGIQRQSERTNELMSLMQDPAFSDSRVQQEIHSILDSDPSIFQRERQPMAYAFERALGSLARKQLQQGVVPERHHSNTPPVTAGGGNGSAHAGAPKITEAIFNSWTDAQQVAYLESNGKVIPKR